MKLSQKIFYAVAGTGVTVVGGILRNKIFAVLLSLNLFGILSITQQSLSLLFTLLSFGLPLGVTVLSSEIVRESKDKQTLMISRIVVVSFAFAIIGLFVISFVLFINPTVVSLLVTGNSKYTTVVSIVLLAAPLMVIQNCLLAIMEGMGKAREILLFKVIPIIISLAITYVFTTKYHLIGAAVGLLVNEILFTLAGLFLLSNVIMLNSEALNVTDVFSRIIKVALLSFGVGISWLTVDFLTKRLVLDVLGEVANGIIQSVGKITDLYPSVALSWLAMHLLPSISEVKTEKSAVINIIHRTTFVAVSLIIPIIIVLFGFRHFILELIYKKEFVQAAEYFGYMLSTGTLKVFSWVIGVGLLAAGFRRHWFYSSLLYAFVYAVVASGWLYISLSFYSLPLGLALALAVQSVYVLLVFKNFGYHFSTTFYTQVVFYLLVSVLLLISIYIELTLFIIVLLYVVFGIYYGLFSEMKIKILEMVSRV